jgi:hypothetical protein
MSITFSESAFVALGIQHAMRMCRIIMPPVAWSNVHFSTLSHKRHDFRGRGAGGVTEGKMCVLIFSEISV